MVWGWGGYNNHTLKDVPFSKKCPQMLCSASADSPGFCLEIFVTKPCRLPCKELRRETCLDHCHPQEISSGKAVEDFDFVCVKENAAEKHFSIFFFFFLQCHLHDQTILSMKIMCPPEFLLCHLTAVLVPIIQKDNQDLIHGECFGLVLLFLLLIVDLGIQRHAG